MGSTFAKISQHFLLSHQEDPQDWGKRSYHARRETLEGFTARRLGVIVSHGSLLGSLNKLLNIFSFLLLLVVILLTPIPHFGAILADFLNLGLSFSLFLRR